jgi:hypothetical protein
VREKEVGIWGYGEGEGGGESGIESFVVCAVLFSFSRAAEKMGANDVFRQLGHPYADT